MKDKDDYLNTRSPYIKNNTLGLYKTRKNILSFGEGDFVSSDSLLYKKVKNISKSVVGSEIKKFAEIASKEITIEFSNLSKQLERGLKETFKDSINKEVKDNIKNFEKNISEDIEIKIEKLNNAISNIEDKIKNLEHYFDSFNKKSLNLKIKNQKKEDDIENLLVEVFKK